MAVYTHLDKNNLDLFLNDFDLGSLVSFKGIDGGIENTNYFITLKNENEESEYVLTLFEELSYEELPYFVELCQWLSDKQIDVPFALKDKNGIGLKKLKNRPAAIQPRFYGEHVAQSELTPEHCAAIGRVLGEFHVAADSFYLERQAHRGVFWWRRESELLSPKLTLEDQQLLKEEVKRFDQLRDQPGDIKVGTIHGDLFHDNVLFQGTEVSAVLDLYNAATAFLLFDLAIVANDWCCNPDGSIDPLRESALLTAYGKARPFTKDEKSAWPILTCTAAMRFWLSRLIPWLDEESEQKLKDPEELKSILLYRRQHPSQLP
ncbi:MULTISPECIES: homoserine kinase [unclassified Neptuniibacter]|uniref:homoserine kinase n=1 Tax=unclassified Neptuniibacter TaxID=2630693 RepID=UPI000C4E7B61|nr:MULTISPECIES: homoserine kinase [unclassified Neptuniibacter]MAY41513.1 homoserine kinase [Oceanospirillaceae bacterium]